MNASMILRHVLSGFDHEIEGYVWWQDRYFTADPDYSAATDVFLRCRDGGHIPLVAVIQLPHAASLSRATCIAARIAPRRFARFRTAAVYFLQRDRVYRDPVRLAQLSKLNWKAECLWHPRLRRWEPGWHWH